ncbi:hypothetical protein BC834DRAFT_971355 [Gloeopeniophorella convolvens]|nr:hypothetical protein BC834DRAFT_971355 [Gloeopeniophorella convolvens]
MLARLASALSLHTHTSCSRRARVVLHRAISSEGPDRRRALPTNADSDRRVKVIRTLDPARLAPEDWLDLSAQERVRVWTATPRAASTPAQGTPHCLRYEATAPFPAGTHGFLYFYRDPAAGAGYGEVRFRVTARGGAFAAGRDLRTRTGLPWQLPPGLLVRTSWAGFAELLARDALVARAQLARWASLYKHSGKSALRAAVLYGLCAHADGKNAHVFLQGTGVVCLEPSALPEHKGQNVAVMRVVRVLEPVVHNPRLGYTPCYPVEGELLCSLRRGLVRKFREHGKSGVCAALRPLWDDHRHRLASAAGASVASWAASEA